MNKKKRGVKHKMLLIMCIVILSVLCMLHINCKNEQIKWEKVEEIMTNVIRYEICIDKFGVPIKEEFMEIEEHIKECEHAQESIMLIYPDIYVNYIVDDSKVFRFIQIYKGKISFGKKKILIGMSREEVEKLMVNSVKEVEHIVYYDGSRVIEENLETYQDKKCKNKLCFIYENNKVKYIYISYGNNR